MKYLVFNGSPKGTEKSDTMHITKAFLDGVISAGDAEIKIITATDKRIEYCRGCFTCKRNGGQCVIDDDMRDILEEILGSDVLLFSFPLYCYGMPAPLKCLIDRTLPLSSMAMRKEGDRYLHLGQKDYGHIKYVMICGCGFPNSKNNFEPAVTQFGLLFPGGEKGKRIVITVPESPMFGVPRADSVTKPRLELVKKAGREYAEKGFISDGLLSEICSPMIPEEVYAKICNGEA